MQTGSRAGWRGHSSNVAHTRTSSGICWQADGACGSAVVHTIIAGAAGGALLAAVRRHLQAALVGAAVQAAAVANRLGVCFTQLPLAAYGPLFAAAWVVG